MAENLHENHRDRVRKGFLANGFDIDTPPHKILEMLLFYSIPRKDTNEIAHRLLNEFGSLSAVLEAPPSALMKIEGVGERTVALLKLIMPIARRYLVEKTDIKEMGSMNDICDYISARHFGYDREVFCVTSLNNAGKILAFDKICEGDIAVVGVPLRDVIETILKRKATAAIISHNHPSGSAVPSIEDVEATKLVARALSTIGVRLLDHIIVVPDDYVSMVQSKQFFSIFKS